MEDSKLESQEAAQRQEIALQILQQEVAGVEEYTNPQLRHLICWKLDSKTLPGALKNKGPKVTKWKELKNKEPPSFEPWTDADEEKLAQLQQSIEGDIALGDTVYARKKAVEVNKAKSLLRGLSKEEKDALLKEIDDDNDDTDANVAGEPLV
ncbi:expressed unknown protein [Seminavis robusta]|uniref:Uncharacterized protein n=1 Tax=Seminavis robusta TaxID=568900 RepID=A0A9N8EZD4_9STRA|nr:expressed unknown protein [Seminavis robusta]|eukprot:Sro2242_g320410.1 n/a (152) ;mRNA; f:5952-6407